MSEYFEADENNGRDACYIKTPSGDISTIFTTKIQCSDSCKLIGSPIESGKMKFDHKVRNPTVVTMTGIAKRASYEALKVVAQVETRSMDANKTCTAYVRGRAIENLMVENFVTIASNDKFDAVEVSITLKELMTYKS